MTWTKLDDGFWSNPKVMDVGNAAAGAYARMLSFCGQQLTEGHVPESTGRFIAKPAELRKLEDNGFLKRNGDGWQIPDYLEFNKSRRQVLAERKAARERMAKVRKK